MKSFRGLLYKRILRLERERRLVSIFIKHRNGYEHNLHIKRFNEICYLMQVVMTNNRDVYDATRPAVREMFARKNGRNSERYTNSDWVLKHCQGNPELLQKARSQFATLDDIPF